MKTVAIIGYGRFGELLAQILRSDFTVTVVEADAKRIAAAKMSAIELIELKHIVSSDIVIFAVPISAIDKVVQDAAPYIHDGQLIMDVCSVKVYPARIMQRHLNNCQIIATHPMFGPDSASKGLKGLQLAVCPINASDANVDMISSFWAQLGVEVILTTPEAHDRDAVYSQAFTYSIAKIILGVDISGVKLATRSFNAIAEVARLSANDSAQLFHDMLYYNPYFKSMKADLIASTDDMKAVLQTIEDEQDQTQIFTGRS